MAYVKTLVASLALAGSVFAAELAAADQVGQASDDVGYQAIMKHDWGTAERQLLVGLQKDPNNVFRQLNLAWVYAQMGRKSEAAMIYRQILMSGDDRVAALPSREGRSVKLLAERGLALVEMR